RRGESIRVFPLSNWTELDVWQYIHLEQIPIVPLYLAAPRPVVRRGGALIMVDDERMRLEPGEAPEVLTVRFRTLGCYPLTGAIESAADTLPKILQEMLLASTSERQGRVIDRDEAASMEKTKQEGDFCWPTTWTSPPATSRPISPSTSGSRCCASSPAAAWTTASRR